MVWATVFMAALWVVSGSLAFYPIEKDHMLSESLLREVVERMDRDLNSYLDQVSPIGGYSNDYQENFNIRDQEYLHHGFLWNNKDLGDESLQRLKPEESKGSTAGKQKPDNTLPAYCNPPNPCPIGFTGKDGCLEDFENTAAFSREYQAQQECMCDTEHMFHCTSNSRNNKMTQINRFVQQLQEDNPYLQGEKLPTAAKKGNGILYREK